jgi:DNA-directed RNA polymerase specialized sigma24 family protein
VMATVEKLKLPPPFDDAVRSMEREIMRFLVRSTGDPEDAMDLFQETWLTAVDFSNRVESVPQSGAG